MEEGYYNKVADELGQERRKLEREVKEDGELMQGLMAHPGWPRYLKMIEAVSQNFYNTVMMPLKSTQDCVASEYAKGTLNGLSVAASLPSAKIREMQDLTPSDAGDGE